MLSALHLYFMRDHSVQDNQYLHLHLCFDKFHMLMQCTGICFVSVPYLAPVQSSWLHIPSSYPSSISMVTYSLILPQFNSHGYIFPHLTPVQFPWLHIPSSYPSSIPMVTYSLILPQFNFHGYIYLFYSCHSFEFPWSHYSLILPQFNSHGYNIPSLYPTSISMAAFLIL